MEQNGDSPYLEMGLIYYVAWEDYVNSLDSLDKGNAGDRVFRCIPGKS